MTSEYLEPHRFQRDTPTTSALPPGHDLRPVNNDKADMPPMTCPACSPNIRRRRAPSCPKHVKRAAMTTLPSETAKPDARNLSAATDASHSNQRWGRGSRHADAWVWQLHARCRGKDPSILFHPDGERGSARVHRQQQAKAFCGDVRCNRSVVSTQCCFMKRSGPGAAYIRRRTKASTRCPRRRDPHAPEPSVDAQFRRKAAAAAKSTHPTPTLAVRVVVTVMMVVLPPTTTAGWKNRVDGR